jgi:pyrroline-5-carboxylate reductase
MKYGFIGFGNLAQALYNGLKNQGSNEFAYVSKTNSNTEIPSFKTISELIEFADIIFIGVKPQTLPGILPELKNLDGKFLVSPVAGKSIQYYLESTGQQIDIVRIMPNLAMAYGLSVTAFCTNAPDSEFIPKIKSDLETLGIVCEIAEENFHEFTAIFGCGPAFLLSFFDAFESRIKALDLPVASFEQLVLGTLKFKSQSSNKTNQELIEAVASKGGVTEAGLKAFKENNFAEIITNAFEAAIKRSKTL